MYDTERNGSSAEITEPTGPVEDASSNPDIAQAAPSEQPEATQTTKSDAERNFEQLRLQKRKLEQERDAYARKLAEIEARNAPKPEPQQETPNLADDDLVEWKHVKREINQLKQELSGFKQQTSQSSAEQKLMSKYPDFNTVVTTENVEMLRDMYPEIASALRQSPDGYDKAAAAYDIIKRYGIYKEDAFASDRALAQKNAAKPKPLTSIAPQEGSSPLDRANAFANGMTKDLQKQLLKEMDDAIRQGY